MEEPKKKSYPKKNRITRKNIDNKDLRITIMHENKKGVASTKPVNVAGCHPKNTTNNLCSLQVVKQKELNDNLSMFPNDELYVGNVFTEKELDEKIARMIEYGSFTPTQLDKIHRYFDHIKESGWFDKFEYRGFLCAVTLDSMGRWRVFVKYQYSSQRDIFYTDEETECYRDSARCGVKGFPLGLWDYGDKIGLDDFIGLCTLVESEWKFDYFGNSRLQRRNKEKRPCWVGNEWRGCSLLDIRTPTKMVKLLVDRFRKEVMKLGLPLDN